MEKACETIKKEKANENKFTAERKKIANQVKNNIQLLIKIKIDFGMIVVCCADHQNDCQELHHAFSLVDKHMDCKELSVLISQLCVKCYTFKQKAFSALIETKREHDKDIAKIEELEQKVLCLL